MRSRRLTAIPPLVPWRIISAQPVCDFTWAGEMHHSGGSMCWSVNPW